MNIHTHVNFVLRRFVFDTEKDTGSRMSFLKVPHLFQSAAPAPVYYRLVDWKLLWADLKNCFVTPGDKKLKVLMNRIALKLSVRS